MALIICVIDQRRHTGPSARILTWTRSARVLVSVYVFGRMCVRARVGRLHGHQQ